MPSIMRTAHGTPAVYKKCLMKGEVSYHSPRNLKGLALLQEEPHARPSAGVRKAQSPQAREAPSELLTLPVSQELERDDSETLPGESAFV